MNNDNNALPLPLVQVSTEHLMSEAFASTGGQPDPSTPLGTAFLWWTGLQEREQYQTALQTLSLNPGVWGDYEEAADILADRSLMSFLVDNPDDSAIKYAKFMRLAGDKSAQAVEDTVVDDVAILTLVKPDDSEWWLVWGLSEDHIPTTKEVRGE
jgi:hypothetical protein